MEDNKDLINSDIVNSDTWDIHHIKHLEYNISCPRLAYYLYIIFDILNINKESTIMEYATGSGRSIIQLIKLGYINSYGSDFSKVAIDKLKIYGNVFTLINFFNSTTKYDITFHDGFFIYFKYEHIYDMIDIQLANTNKIAIIVLHNYLNIELINTFKVKSITDSLYNINWLNYNKLLNYIIKKYNYKINIFKYGYLKNNYINLDNYLKENYKNEVNLQYIKEKFIELNSSFPIEKCERIILVIEKCI